MFDPYPHQLAAVRDMKNGCILKGDVGTGKSVTAILYYYTKVCGGMPRTTKFERKEMVQPTDLYIITPAKKRNDAEWEGDLLKFELTVSTRVTNVTNVKIVIDSWQNIMKYKDVKNAFFIFDEQKLVGSGPWVKAFLQIAKENEWIVLSATPGDAWVDYIPIFVANGFYKNRTEFLRRHVVYSAYTKFPKIERYLEQGHLLRLRSSITVNMVFQRHTNRKMHNVLVEYDKELYDEALKKRWHVYEDRPIKDVGELFGVLRKIVNSDVSRLGETIKLLETHPKLIMFYNFNYELDMLRPLQTTLNLPVAEWNGHKHEAIPSESDTWLYLVQYMAGSEGWNCVETNATAFWSLNYSYKITEQARGRIDRLNTPFVDLHYYQYRSESSIDKAIHKALATKRDFNERDFQNNLQ